GRARGRRRRKVGSEIQRERARLGSRRSSRAMRGGAPRQRRRASAEVELQLATGGLGRRRRGERGHGGAEGRRFDRSAVIQLERLVLPAGGEVDPGRPDQVSRGARRIAEFGGTLSAAGGGR